MAYTEHLSIYKSAYDLCLWPEQVVQGFRGITSIRSDRICATVPGGC